MELHAGTKVKRGQELNGPELLNKTSNWGQTPLGLQFLLYFFIFYLIQLFPLLINFFNLVYFHKNIKITKKSEKTKIKNIFYFNVF